MGPQLKKYHEHAVGIECGAYISSLRLSIGFMKWDGVNRGNEEEFDLKKGLSWLTCYNQLEKKFYLHEAYIPKHKCFSFVVYTAETEEDGEKYSALLTID